MDGAAAFAQFLVVESLHVVQVASALRVLEVLDSFLVVLVLLVSALRLVVDGPCVGAGAAVVEDVL